MPGGALRASGTTKPARRSCSTSASCGCCSSSPPRRRRPISRWHHFTQKSATDRSPPAKVRSRRAARSKPPRSSSPELRRICHPSTHHGAADAECGSLGTGGDALRSVDRQQSIRGADSRGNGASHRQGKRGGPAGPAPPTARRRLRGS